MLEQHRVATEGRVEDADVGEPLDREQQHRDAEDRRREHLHDRRRVHRPDVERHLEPAHALRPELVDGHQEVEAGEDRREAEDEHADQNWNGSASAELRRIRRVEGPARIRRTGNH